MISMQLRNLKNSDIPLIYEWMKDPEVNRHFRFDPEKISHETIKAFVEEAQNKQESLHLACVDSFDQYLGTVSLKHIDYEAGKAEYAISFRKSAQGTGAAWYATHQILRIAFQEMKLHRVFLNVMESNEHACRFYEKSGFKYEGLLRDDLKIKGQYCSLKLYAILEDEYNERNDAQVDQV